ncbi:MAG: septal ring lytic transglycosylase RlpA family protein [Bryobacteraceae bacterium]|nr:septal ring lytic transglycosylase RlpA family protein [Bryobacteraceae bacterium]
MLKSQSQRVGIVLLCLVATLLIASCGGRKVRSAKPPRTGSTETGVASWYGHPYHGRRAANGEVYDMEKLTAAHRTLPFNTWVRVLNLTNDKTVEVRIQDRGPFIDNRIIDLSRAAAREIDMIGPGISKVRLTIIAAPPQQQIEKQSELFSVQVGAFRDKVRAEAIREAMQEKYGAARIIERSGEAVIYRVLVGSLEDEARAEALAQQIRASGTTAFTVRLDGSR